MLKKFKMDSCKPIGTLVECTRKLSKFVGVEKVDATKFKSLVGSFQYFTCTRLNIIQAIDLIIRYMETPTSTHLKAAKRILRYIKGTIDFGLWFSTCNVYKLVGYNDNNWAIDEGDWKSTCVFHGEHSLHLDVKKIADSHSFDLRGRIHSSYFMHLPCSLAQEFVKRVGHVTRTTDQDLCG